MYEKVVSLGKYFSKKGSFQLKHIRNILHLFLAMQVSLGVFLPEVILLELKNLTLYVTKEQRI